MNAPTFASSDIMPHYPSILAFMSHASTGLHTPPASFPSILQDVLAFRTTSSLRSNSDPSDLPYPPFSFLAQRLLHGEMLLTLILTDEPPATVISPAALLSIPHLSPTPARTPLDNSSKPVPMNQTTEREEKRHKDMGSSDKYQSVKPRCTCQAPTN